MKGSKLLTVLFSIGHINRTVLELFKIILSDLRSTLTPIQGTIICTIGTARIRISDIKKSGYNTGANLSHNMNKITQKNYIVSEQSEEDHRVVEVRLTSKGIILYKEIVDKLDKFQELYNRYSKANLNSTTDVLGGVEDFLAQVTHSSFYSKAIPNKITFNSGSMSDIKDKK